MMLFIYNSFGIEHIPKEIKEFVKNKTSNNNNNNNNKKLKQIFSEYKHMIQ